LADAAGLTVAHAGVRIQRTREQLELARAVVAALSARPACSQLSGLIADWDGRPSALWRKRIFRHARSCPACTVTAEHRIPAERLLASLPVLAVPAGLAQATIAQTAAIGVAPAAAAATGIKAIIAELVLGHPLATVVAGITAAAAITAPMVLQPEPEPRRPSVIAAPAPTAATPPPSTASSAIPLGRLSLEWAGGGYLTTGRNADVAAVSDIGASSDAQSRRRATFVAVAGLADRKCVSFRTVDGRYLRHYELKGYTHAYAPTDIFRRDATYCPQPGITGDSVMLKSLNYPDFYLRWTGTRFGIGYRKDTPDFRTASSFRVRPALAPD
jgi:hypothetical protein